MNTTPIPATTIEFHLAERPVGWPTADTFRRVERTLPPLAEGEVRVANRFVSVDPYMRGRMNLGESYVAPFELNEALTGGAVGHVVESNAPELPVGTAVSHDFGWRSVAQGPAASFRRAAEIPGVPLSTSLGILGMTGLTAFVGLRDIASIKPGDVVFISGAAGAVGTAAGQIARLMGASRVIGSAGTAAKVALLTERYGFDAAFNYTDDAPVAEQLAAAAPEGIDVYFDNVGGEHLEAAIGAFRRGGRAALCGAIAEYNTTEPAVGPRNMSRIITQSITLRGFTLGDHVAAAPAFAQAMGEWFAAGEIVYDETVVAGIENTPQAFIDLLRGANIGKMVVRVDA
ncbi:NADP-dependent oxidoreductase [Mycetocola tolaasinivorans]|uniref:NADP-dependent oxidoreductase n=1 Tax=Mycetocola tolaasinivorans TaxID=76635 RepID=A0A3L7A9F8_9MICO|nr:NADP-dependent oxidoreductase [Mycetocola tolaasinivorans]RLP76983.1 NADP-dependent oxidoreductase [Mycetocola tolaasinivorans]